MNIPYSVIEAIKERHSVRTYEPRPVADELKAKIDRYISLLDNPFGVKVDIRHVDIAQAAAEGEKLGTYGVIKGATTFYGLAVNLEQPLALIAAGYQFENLVLYITSLGLGTVWLGGTFNRSKFFEAMGFDDNDYFPAVSPVGYPQKKRLLEKVMRRMVSADKRKPWSELFFDGDFAHPLSEADAGRYALPLEMLRLAPSAVNAQPWRVLKVGDTFHFFETHKDKLSEGEKRMKLLDLGIAICHFHLVAQQSLNMNGRFVVEPPTDIANPADYHYYISWHA